MKSLEAYKKRVIYGIVSLICGGTIFVVGGLTLFVAAIIINISAFYLYGFLFGGFLLFIGVVFFIILPFWMKHGKKTIQKDEAELEYLRNGGKGNDNKF